MASGPKIGRSVKRSINHDRIYLNFLGIRIDETMQVKSTSFHTLSADRGLNRLEQSLWLFYNRLNNLVFPNASGSLSIRDFVVDLSDNCWNQTYPESSPSRKLSDLFWMQLPWDAIQAELGQICVLDVGCGSGDYFPRLQMFSGHRITSYKGIDIAPNENWDVLKKKYTTVEFQKLNSKDVRASIPQNTNFIISQSAVEHFEQDVTFFEQIRTFIQQASKNVIQIHLLPSSACFRLYGFHGVRQYTPRSLSILAKPFQKFSSAVVYRLGGDECNRLHWDFITQPSLTGKPDMRNTETQRYDRELREAIGIDNQQPHSNPGFYALVIHSNHHKIIFK